MNELIFTVPGHARGKGRPRATAINGHARVYADPKTVEYEGRVRNAARRAMAGREPFSVPLSLFVLIRVAPPASVSKKTRAAMLAGEIRPAKKPDLSNIVKAIEDGANVVAYTDDALIVRLSAVKTYAEAPGVDVKVQPLEPQESPAWAA